jgi:hypothetical protein
LGDLLWVIFGVTFGAALLMLAQVMIPNFRKCLRMESDIDGLTEGLHAIDSGVEGRLYSRCQQEVENARSALFMKASDAFSLAIASFDLWSRFRGRFALSGDSFEVDRLASLLPRINTRISCTQRLNDCQLASASRAMRLPVSLQWQRRQFFLDVQRILSTRLLTETDENSVSASLDKLTDDTGSYAAFAADLENRLALLRKQFGVDPLKTKSSSLISQLNGCRQLLDETPTNATFGVDELISRDLRAIRLELVRQRFDLEALLSSDFSKNFSTEICSEDPVRLYAVRGDLLMASEGVTEAQIRAALEAGRIDAISEPVSLTNRDLFRVSLQFRNPALQHSTARRFFQCDWHVVPQTKGHEKGETKDDYYEDGWETQFMLRRGCYLISPRVRDRDGQEIPLVDDQRQPRTPFTVEVTAPPGSALYARAWRGLVDALITALVPVITVAVTQFQAGGNLSLSTLILLGFTSQAIRAAVLPESVTAPLKTSSPTTNT